MPLGEPSAPEPREETSFSELVSLCLAGSPKLWTRPAPHSVLIAAAATNESSTRTPATRSIDA